MSELSAFDSYEANQNWQKLKVAGDELGDQLNEALTSIYAKIPTYLDNLSVFTIQKDLDQAALRQQQKLVPAIETLNKKPLRDRQFIHAQLTAIAAALDITTPDPVE